MLDVDLLVNAINRELQHPKLELNVSVAMVMSLKSCCRRRAQHTTMKIRQRPRNVRFGCGPASDAVLTPQKFRVSSYIPVIDQFFVSLAHRLSGFLTVSGQT